MAINNIRETEYEKAIDTLLNLTANEQVIFGSIIGIMLGQNLNPNEQNAVGNFLMLIAQELCTLGAQNQMVQMRTRRRNNAENDDD